MRMMINCTGMIDIGLTKVSLGNPSEIPLAST